MKRRVVLSLVVAGGLALALCASTSSGASIFEAGAPAFASSHAEDADQIPVAPSLLSADTPDGTEENRAVRDVERAFDNLAYQGEWLGAYIHPYLGPPDEQWELFPGVPYLAHIQGIARSPRTDGPPVFYVSVSTGGVWHDSYPAIAVVQMASLPTNGERLGSNRLEKGKDTMFTRPPEGDEVVKMIKTNSAHPSGMSMTGDILAVPMSGFVHFYDCREPTDPQRLAYALPYIDPSGASTGAQGVAITKLPTGRFLLVTNSDKGAHFYFSSKTSFFETDPASGEEREATDVFHESIPAFAPLPDGWTESNSVVKCNSEREDDDPDRCRRHRIPPTQYKLRDRDYLQSGARAGYWPFKGGGPANSRTFQGMSFVNQVDESGDESLFLIGHANSHESSPRLCCFGDDELYLLEVYSAESENDPPMDLVTLMPPYLHLRGVAQADKKTRSAGVKKGGTEKISYKYTVDALIFTKRWQANFNAGAGAYVSPSGELLYYGASHFADGNVSRNAHYNQTGRKGSYVAGDFLKMAEYANRYVSTDPTAPDDARMPGSCEPELREKHLGGPYSVLGGSTALRLNGAVASGEPWVRMFDNDDYTGQSVMLDYRNQKKDDYRRFSDLDGEYGECQDRWFAEVDGQQQYNGFNNCMSSFYWCGPVGTQVAFYKDDDCSGASRVLSGTGTVEGVVLGAGNKEDPDYDDDWEGLNNDFSSVCIEGQALYAWTLGGDGKGTLVPDPLYPGVATYTPGYGSSMNTVTMTFLGQYVATTTIQVLGPEVVLSGPASVREGETHTYTFTTEYAGDDPLSVAHQSCGPYGLLSHASFDTVSGNGSFECTFTDGPSSSTVSVQVSDSEGALSNVASIDVAISNVAPVVTVDVSDQTYQYSDAVCTVTFTATDVVADVLAAATIPDPLPDGFVLTSVGCSALGVSQICAWELTSTKDQPAGYQLSAGLMVRDEDAGTGSAETTITVEAEDADVWLESENPVAVQVVSPGGDSPEFSLTAYVKETIPDVGCYPAPGDISNAVVEVMLLPVGPGSSYTVQCASAGGVIASGGYGDVLEVRCVFEDVEVNAYHVQATVVGDYYRGGPDEAVVVVFDPSLGFTTGGGWFEWPGTEEKTHFGYTVKYNRKATRVQGSLLLIRRVATGETYRAKSNALHGLSLGESDDPAFGWAAFAGKCTYEEPDWDEAVGNHAFLVYVEDHGEPGRDDVFWIEIYDKDRHPIAVMSMDRPARSEAEPLEGGNIVVPHKAGRRGRPGARGGLNH